MCNSTNDYIPAGMINFIYYYNQNPCILCLCQTRNSINILRTGKRANLFFFWGNEGKPQLLSATNFIIVFNSLGVSNKNHFQHLQLFFSSRPVARTTKKVHAFKVLQFLLVIILVHVIRSTGFCIQLKSKKAFTQFRETVSWSDFGSYRPKGTQHIAAVHFSFSPLTYFQVNPCLVGKRWLHVCN